MTLGTQLKKHLAAKQNLHVNGTSLDRNLRTFNLTVSQYEIMDYLAEHGPVTMGQIADALGYSRGNMTNVCDRLETKNIISRERPNDDRRTVVIALAAHGTDLYNSINAEVAAD